jgi:hypothetical protein
MSSADVELADAWRTFQRLPFPHVAGRDAVVDLAGFDALVAGVVSHVVQGQRIPDDSRHEFREDHRLRDRIAELEDPAATEYLARLEQLIDITTRADASRAVER